MVHNMALLQDQPPATLPFIGIGLRQPHYKAVFEALPKLDFLEVHSENFFAPGGASAAVLAQARTHYPISLHGVGLSLGSAIGIDTWHLQQLKDLVQRTDPLLVSDHASFARGNTAQGQVHGNDLLPLRFTHASLNTLCSNVTQVQDYLRRRIAVENLSAYVRWQYADFSETDFLNALTQRTGCGLLLDVNNLYVNACNTTPHASIQERCQQVQAWIQAINPHSVLEMHVAGFTPSQGLIIDDHASPVHEPVWQLYHYAQKRFPATPTIVVWDLNLPTLDILLAQATTARQYASSALTSHHAP